MHTFTETGAGVPAFLAKLWRLVEDPETNDLISWNTDGRSFIIQNQAQFAKELLPLNYKHNNMASFIRQLNMYGFHKITSIDNGGLRFDKDEMEFTHPCFQKNHPYLLDHIKRKIANSKQQQQDDKNSSKVENVNRVLSEMKNMRGRQDSLDARFSSMKQENEALWREIAILRQKHLKQQQIVNKLIQFLVTIVQPSRSGLGSMGNGNNKRRFQLMINDAPPPKTKKTGATIQELGEVLEEVVYENEQELLSSEMAEVTSPISINTQSPYRSESVNEIIEEVTSPLSTRSAKQSRATVKQEKSDDSASATMRLMQETENTSGNEIPSVVDYDDEEYQVDHVEEYEGSGMDMYNDSDMLNTPMVMEEIQRQQNMEQIRQQNLQKSATKSESLLKARKNGANNNKMQRSLLSNTTQQFSSGSTNSSKEMSTASSININKAGPSGINTFVPNADTSSFVVNDFIVTEVPNEIFEDSNNQPEKQSPMLGAINFEGGFYNPNVNINEIKDRQQQTQAGPSQERSFPVEPTEKGSDSNGGRELARFVSNDQDLNRLNTINDFGHHIDSVQTDLDSLKDLLKGEGYQLDANTLLGLFAGNEDVIGYDFPMNLPEADGMGGHKKGDVSNNAGVTASLQAPTGTATASNQLTAYKSSSGGTSTAVTGDYIDLNELLDLEGGTEEDRSLLI